MAYVYSIAEARFRCRKPPNTGYFQERRADFDFLAQPENLAKYLQVFTENAGQLTRAEFIEKYEKTNSPVLIHGTTSSWPASSKWSPAQLAADFAHCTFMVGEDANFDPVMVTMDDFVKYMDEQQDDYPLYMFDATFGLEGTERMLVDYRTPTYFPVDARQDSENTREGETYYDLLGLLGAQRPPHRWILMGPQRSGSAVHVDPYSTSAWNAVLHGQKLWVLMPPEVDEGTARAVKQLEALGAAEPSCASEEGNDADVLFYFLDLLPRLRHDQPNLHIYLFVQEAGQTLFVPSGWWHAALNTKDSVAVGQNYCSDSNFTAVWRDIRQSEYDPSRAEAWLEKLKVHRPDLAALATKIDEEACSKSGTLDLAKP